MKYMGSKSRIAKYIVPIIQEYIDKNEIKNYLEPFVGGANVIDKVKCEHGYGFDNNEYLISLYKNIDKIDTLPSKLTKNHYSEVRDCYNSKSDMYPIWYIGMIGFLGSYNGRFFDGGYAGIVHTKAGTSRDYYNEAKRNLTFQIPDLNNIEFDCLSYDKINPTIHDHLIYCDPPYANTKQYGTSKNFDHDKFWQWCRKMSINNIVIVSEQVAPADFEVIWEQEIRRTINNNKRVKIAERLFVWKG